MKLKVNGVSINAAGSFPKLNLSQVNNSGNISVQWDEKEIKLDWEDLSTEFLYLILSETASRLNSERDIPPEKIMDVSLQTIKSITGIEGETAENLIRLRGAHASSDPYVAKIMKFSNGAVERILDDVKSGKRIVCDSKMTLNGIYAKTILEKNKPVCLIDDEETKDLSRIMGITKSAAAVSIAVKRYKEPIFVVGNAPTALEKIVEMWKDKLYNGSVIGTPLGFVGATASKEHLISSSLTYITVPGYRGGSAIAASIINTIGGIIK